MTATLNVVVSINLTTVMQTYWTASHLKNRYLARNSSFLKNNHKIDFAKKLFNYENTGRKKEAVKNIRKSETVVSLPTCACSDAS